MCSGNIGVARARFLISNAEQNDGCIPPLCVVVQKKSSMFAFYFRKKIVWGTAREDLEYVQPSQFGCGISLIVSPKNQYTQRKSLFFVKLSLILENKAFQILKLSKIVLTNTKTAPINYHLRFG